MNGTEFVIKIDMIYFLGIMGSLILIAWYAGSRVSSIETSIKWIKEQLDDVSRRVFTLWEERVARARSPIKLNQRGEDILEKSGIKDLIDNGLPQFLDSVKEKNPQNAYQVQEFSKEAVFRIKLNPEILTKLQNGAFGVGTDIDTLLLVGGIYLRDLLLLKLGFKLEDVDKKE